MSGIQVFWQNASSKLCYSSLMILKRWDSLFASGYSHIEQKEKLVIEVDSNEFSQREGQVAKEQALFNSHSSYLLQPAILRFLPLRTRDLIQVSNSSSTRNATARTYSPRMSVFPKEVGLHCPGPEMEIRVNLGFQQPLHLNPHLSPSLRLR